MKIMLWVRGEERPTLKKGKGVSIEKGERGDYRMNGGKAGVWEVTRGRPLEEDEGGKRGRRERESGGL